MDEYIKRKALLKLLEERREFLFKENGDYDHYSNGFDEAVDKVENFPIAADVAERKRGEWVENKRGFLECTECKFERIGIPLVHRLNFCPNCGADMRERKGGE